MDDHSLQAAAQASSSSSRLRLAAESASRDMFTSFRLPGLPEPQPAARALIADSIVENAIAALHGNPQAPLRPRQPDMPPVVVSAPPVAAVPRPPQKRLSVSAQRLSPSLFAPGTDTRKGPYLPVGTHVFDPILASADIHMNALHHDNQFPDAAAITKERVSISFEMVLPDGSFMPVKFEDVVGLGSERGAGYEIPWSFVKDTVPTAETFRTKLFLDETFLSFSPPFNPDNFRMTHIKESERPHRGIPPPNSRSRSVPPRSVCSLQCITL